MSRPIERPRLYTFRGEFGVKTLSYPEYLEDAVMRKRINDPSRCFLNLGLNVLTYDAQWLDNHPQEKAIFERLRTMQEENPLQFFLPNGKGGLAFLNDSTHDVKALVCPNRVGKTATMVVDLILDSMPTDPSWPIFSQHGVKYRPFIKPMQFGFASYIWQSVRRTLWPEIKKWIPKYELGEFSKGREPNWQGDPHVELQSLSNFFMFCYEQPQGIFEGQVLNRFGWDEQGDEAKFDGVDERLRTTHGRHVFGLTPHKVEGRPDTGARSWINKMLSGASPKGHNCAVYQVGVDEVPDWVYPEIAKEQARQKHIVQPEKEHNVKAIREGRSRFYGEWHEAGGLIFDDWDEKVHLCDDFQIPDSWTRYRIIDHGDVNPTACLWLAVDPDSEVWLYRELYKSDNTVSQNCREIIKLSGNKMEESSFHDKKSGLSYTKIIEHQNMERYRFTIMDSRSRGTTDSATHLTLDKLYAMFGIRTHAATGLPTTELIPIAKEWMAVKEGKSRFHVFRSLENWRRERQNYAREEFVSGKAALNANEKEKPRAKDNHLMDCTLYGLACPPKYVIDRWAFYGGKNKNREEDEEDNPRRKHRFVDGYTGY